jgi:hypothetical protein
VTDALPPLWVREIAETACATFPALQVGDAPEGGDDAVLAAISDIAATHGAPTRIVPLPERAAAAGGAARRVAVVDGWAIDLGARAEDPEGSWPALYRLGSGPSDISR